MQQYLALVHTASRDLQQQRMGRVSARFARSTEWSLFEQSLVTVHNGIASKCCVVVCAAAVLQVVAAHVVEAVLVSCLLNDAHSPAVHEAAAQASFS